MDLSLVADAVLSADISVIVAWIFVDLRWSRIITKQGVRIANALEKSGKDRINSAMIAVQTMFSVWAIGELIILATVMSLLAK